MQNVLKQFQLPESNSLSEAQRQTLTQAIQDLSNQQLNWASGYLAGLSQAQIPQVTVPQELPSITVLYASQTGNAQSVAQQLADQYQAKGIQVKLTSIADYRVRDLSKENYLLLVISTQGDGEAPESAFEFEQQLFSDRAPKLEQLNFAVFALGDSSYPDFCQAGRNFDDRLQSLGARRLLDRVDADINFEDTAAEWQDTVIQHSNEWLSLSTDNVVSLNAINQAIRFDRTNPFRATVLDNRRITTQDAVADIHHIELQIDPASLQYQPGDSLGVWSRNDVLLIAEIIEILRLDAATQIQFKNTDLSLQKALETKLEVTQLHPSVINAWTNLTDYPELKQLNEDKEQLRAYASKNQLIDLIQRYPATLDAQTLVETLLPLQPRLYSIASSQQAYDDEIHLTVSALEYHNANDALRKGSASSYLNHRINTDDLLDVYIAENNQFRLPENSDTPIIMIGAGTGIAPYRAFLQQREAESAKGENWLVFGNRNFHRDFLYQLEWQKHHHSGLLNRISLAFSRDHNEKVYVQDRLFEEAEELYSWLEKGAQLYVCGSTDLDHAVHQVLQDIVQQFADLTAEQAEQYVNKLRADGRYQRDVY